MKAFETLGASFVFFGVMFAYSLRLTLIVLIGLPVYILIGVLVRPPLRSAYASRTALRITRNPPSCSGAGWVMW